ncbi:MAG: ABC transporter permease [Candidatus Kapaibacterium sp.]|nr:ABC transporter permease [Bacteroidota bacterium]
MIPFWIARRYIFARRTLQFISFITLLSLAGIAVGVAAIVCVSSIFNGFYDITKSMMLRFDPHIKVQAAKGAYIPNVEAIVEQIRKSPEVKTVVPVLSGRVVIRHGESIQISEIQGIKPQEVESAIGADNIMLNGTFLRENVDESSPTILIGVGLANKLSLVQGDTVYALSPAFIENALQAAMIPQGKKFIVSGIFGTGDKEYDNTWTYAESEDVADLLGTEKGLYSSIDIRLKNFENAEQLAEDLSKQLPTSLSVNTWYDLHKDLYTVMKFERKASFIILAIIVLVSVFNIFALLTMTVVKKQADIGLLKAIGADDRTIQSIFLYEGLTIGITGTVLGLVIGLILCYGQLQFEWFKLNGANFIISAIPIKIAWIDIAAICGLTIAFSFLATIFPAKRAAKTVITSALRSE